jgi:hypothetical protein
MTRAARRTAEFPEGYRVTFTEDSQSDGSAGEGDAASRLRFGLAVFLAALALLLLLPAVASGT